jgi:hypothetical protein
MDEGCPCDFSNDESIFVIAVSQSLYFAGTMIFATANYKVDTLRKSSKSY